MRQDAIDLIAVLTVPGIGYGSAMKLFREAGSVPGIFDMSDGNLRSILGNKAPSRKRLTGARRSERLKEELDFMRCSGIRALSWTDSEYPGMLRNIFDPPAVIFIKGEIRQSDTNSIALVGGRRCSLHGSRMALRLSGDLASEGYTVVSGMARGIDTAAHKGALSVKGRTIAVMGSGFGNIYPPEADELASKIGASGAVITEYLHDVRPARWTFPRRNRLVSGLSRGVVVVEASQKSGALITAGLALEQGREVFAIPGNADSPSAIGSNRLIQEGAKLVLDRNDIIEELGSYGMSGQVEQFSPENGPKDVRDLSPAEQSVAEMVVSSGEPHVDEISRQTGHKGGDLTRILMELELKGYLKVSPGNRYSSLI